MKKYAFFYAYLMVIAFLVTGCRENYLAEKEFFKANKILKSIPRADLTSNPESSLAPAIQAFERVAERYPLTPKAADSLFLVSGLWAKQKKYEEAREALAKIIQNFTGRREWAAEARFQMGQLYEIEGNWEQAEEAFWETAEYHPGQQKGLFAPLYILAHYKKVGDPVKQQEAYEKALEHYRRMLGQVGPIEASAALRNSVALAHLSQGKLAEARGEWSSLVDTFPRSPYAPLALLAMADLSWKQKDYEHAFLNYGQFLGRYPKHSLASRTAVRLGILYNGRGQFTEAREWFERAITQYFQKDHSGTADLKLLIGKAYQEEGKWEEAEKVYRKLESAYPQTLAVLQVPLMRFVYYKSIGKTDAAHKILDDAIQNYRKLVSEKPKSKLATYAKQFIFSAYTQRKDWDQLMASADQELKDETNEEKKGRWLFLKALIAENRLRDREQAFQLYQDFLAQYPDHHLSQLAKSHLELLATRS